MKQEQKRTSREWVALVEEQEKSKMTIKRFCKVRRLNRHTFMYWRQKVTKHPQAAQKGFVNLKVGKAAREERIILRTSSGIELDLPGSYPNIDLQQLLKTLSC